MLQEKKQPQEADNYQYILYHQSKLNHLLSVNKSQEK